jgi:hypothetical protein
MLLPLLPRGAAALLLLLVPQTLEPKTGVSMAGVSTHKMHLQEQRREKQVSQAAAVTAAQRLLHCVQ